MSCYSCDGFVTLRWLNTLGGWEYWTFTARSTHGLAIGNVKDFKPDIFDNWDTDFIAGSGDTETLSLDAAETMTLRTGGLTKDQANGLSTIKYSLNVQTVSNGQTVQIDRGSFDYRTDREKNIELSFKITKAQIQIQTG